jgi:mono/diheme cytochrome c family protein
MKKLSLVFVAVFTIFLLPSCGSTNEVGNADNQPSKPHVASGEDIYKQTCITCHQANGAGIPNTYPPLAKSDYLADKEKVISQVIKGSSAEITVNGAKYSNMMPPQQLNDEEIAAVLTYVYGNFGNSGGTVTPDEVKGVRAKL